MLFPLQDRPERTRLSGYGPRGDSMQNSYGAKGTLSVSGSTYGIYRLAACGPAVARLPMSLKVLLENLLRHEDGRVLRQDFTGVPAVADLAAMREAVSKLGGNPDRINPLQPADLVIDHSVQVDRFATLASLRQNAELEYQRNEERYAFLRWGAQAF